LHFFPRHQVAAQQASDCFSVFLCDWGKEAQEIRERCIPLPTQAHYRVTIAKQPSISGIACDVGIAPVNQGNNDAIAAIGNFQQQRSIALSRVLRADGYEVRRELDLTIFQIHCIIEIDDVCIVWIRNSNRKINASGDPLITPAIAKRLAPKDIITRGDLNANDARVERRKCQKQKGDQRTKTLTHPHGRKDSTLKKAIGCAQLRQHLPIRFFPVCPSLARNDDNPNFPWAEFWRVRKISAMSPLFDQANPSLSHNPRRNPAALDRRLKYTYHSR